MTRRTFIKSLFCSSVAVVIPTSSAFACTIHDPDERFIMYQNELYENIRKVMKDYLYESATLENLQTMTERIKVEFYKFFDKYDIPLYVSNFKFDYENNLYTIEFRITPSLKSFYKIDWHTIP